MIGGFGTVAICPSILLEAVARKGVKDITAAFNTTGFSLDV